MVIHPLLLHFPVALLFTGTVTLVIGLVRPGLFRKITTGQAAFEGFVSGVLGLGFAGLVLTVVTGLFDMQASPKTQARDGWIIIAVLHIITAVSLLAVYGSLLYRRFVILPPSTLAITGPEAERAPGSTPPENFRLDWPSLVLAGLGLILLVVAGWLGGTLVYEYRVGVG